MGGLITVTVTQLLYGDTLITDENILKIHLYNDEILIGNYLHSDDETLIINRECGEEEVYFSEIRKLEVE